MHKRGYAHRDIKPENILINCFVGGEFEVKIGDLELAVLLPNAYLGDEEKKQDNTQPGSRRYAAPELLQHGILTQRADVFSYGIVAYELFEGKHPFGGEDAQQTATLICDKLAYRKIRRTIRKSKNIPPLLKPIIAKCLEYDPKKRYAHAGELLAELNAVNYQQHHPSFFARIFGWG
jgi:serine/threonine-protein kinase